MTKSKRWRASKEIQNRAHELRKNMTSAEKKLWNVLCAKQLDGYYFRRQHAVGSYIVDFFCAKVKLIIEVDGGSHLEQVEYDKERTCWLEEEKGYRVIRFTNDDIFKSINEVAEAIREVVKRPHPSSPASGGGASSSSNANGSETSSPPARGGS